MRELAATFTDAGRKRDVIAGGGRLQSQLSFGRRHQRAASALIPVRAISGGGGRHFSCCGNWRSVAARAGYCIHEPKFPARRVRRYSSNKNRFLRGLGGATPCGRLACTTSLFVAARSWMAPARPHLAATLPLQKAGSPPSAASRDLPGARSMPRG